MFRVLLVALLLTGCAVQRHHVHYRPCGSFEDGETRRECLVDTCPCEFPGAEGFDPCCLPLGWWEVQR